MEPSGSLELPQAGAALSLEGNYAPIAAITTSKTMTTSKPADETAAAVSSPEIEAAIVMPDRTSMIMKRIIIPRGVRMMLMMLPPPLPFPMIPPPQRTQRDAKLRKCILEFDDAIDQTYIPQV